MNREGWRGLSRAAREMRRDGLLTPETLPGLGGLLPRVARVALALALRPQAPPRPRMEALREMARKARKAGDAPAFAWLDSRPLPFRPPLP